MQEFKNIPQYEELYKINKFGVVVKKSNNMILAQHISKCGYYRVNLRKDSRNNATCIHRLLGLTFLEKPDDKHIQIDHINRNRLDNKLENLRWVTLSMQNKNRSRFKRKKKTGCLRKRTYSSGNTAYRVLYFEDHKRASKTFDKEEDAKLFLKEYQDREYS